MIVSARRIIISLMFEFTTMPLATAYILPKIHAGLIHAGHAHAGWI